MVLPAMFHNVKQVSPIADYRLHVLFTDGERREYDGKPLVERWSIFQSLCSVPHLFAQVPVDQGGYGIRWNDDLDLSCNELYEHGTPCSQN